MGLCRSSTRGFAAAAAAAPSPVVFIDKSTRVIFFFRERDHTRISLRGKEFTNTGTTIQAARSYLKPNQREPRLLDYWIH
jgi:hypothetical protein